MSPMTTATTCPAETTANGSSTTAPHGGVPQKTQYKASRWRYLVAAAIIVIAGTGATFSLWNHPFHRPRLDLLTHKVQRENLLLTIVERGTLESANSKDVVCRVRAGGRSTPVVTKIHIEDGDEVREGDLLVELDDSGLQEALKSETIVLDQAKAAYIEAKENLTIVLSQNESDVSNAKIAHELAVLRLKSYMEGEYEQQLKDIEGRALISLSDLEQWRDRAAWSERMVKKGYLSPSQAESEQAKLKSAEVAYAKVLEEKRVLTEYTKKIRETELSRQHDESLRDLQRWEARTNARRIQAETSLQSKESLYEQALRRHAELEEEIAKCKIHAPQDGMVVFYVPEQARFGGGSQQSIIDVGEPVREGQKLMSIPNLDRMVVHTNVHEVMSFKIRGGERAMIRIDPIPDQVFTGKVLSVATVASKQDWLSADVKLYKTVVSIEESVPGLKPGMSARVTILIDSCCNDVLTIPVQAIVGAADMGKTRTCFVHTPTGPVEREIVVGVCNDRMAEITSGLEEGEEVIINPKVLLSGKVVARTSGIGKEEARLAEEDKRSDKSDQKGKKGRSAEGGKSKEKKSFDMETIVEEYRSLNPEERRSKLEQVPEAFRDKLRTTLQARGIEIPD